MSLIRSRILWRLFAAYATVVVLTALVGAGIASYIVQRDAQSDIVSTLDAKAVLLAGIATPVLSGAPNAGFEAQIREMGQGTGARLTVIAADGRVLADSEQDPAVMDNHLQRPEIVAARETGAGTEVRFSKTLRMQMIYYALPVRAGGQIIGYVRTALSDELVHRRLRRMAQLVMAGALAALLLSLLPSYWFAWRLGQRVSQISIGAQAAAHGDYTQRLSEGGQTELDELARSINALAANLRAQLDTATSERNQMQTILGGMVEGVIAIDAEQRIVHINQAAQALCSAESGDLRGKKLWEAVRIPAVLDALQAALEAQQPSAREVRIAKAGGDQTVEIICARLQDSQGRPAGAVAVLHDVSRMRQLEQVRSEFVANASHELKTPLTAIHGLVETLLDDEQMEPQVRTRFLGRLREQSLRLDALINDMLALSRAESKGEEFEHQPVDLRDVLQESQRTLAAAAASRQIGVDLLLPGELVVVSGDRKALGQAVDNLLDNAIKYTPDGGRIWLKLSSTAALALIEVRDTGVGIGAEHLERIFERFYRVDRARSRELGGTGLGLAIVKHIVLSHGGTVRVQSAVGQGSVFSVELPLLIQP
jgi:two-component system, OmpR family, phosphate regulon sensor histidine kinase PhoR